MEVKERGKETKTYQHDQEGWISGFSRTRSSTRDQEGHQLHMRQVQFTFISIFIEKLSKSILAHTFSYICSVP